VSYKVAGTDWKLTISDNGIGKPHVSASETKPGLGTGLIKALTRQLDARSWISQAMPAAQRSRLLSSPLKTAKTMPALDPVVTL
ncbi:MAG: hypothetical protein WAN64_17130, partial [Pseudolabrys sp.]